MIRHECGLFGIYEHKDAARLAYFGLYAQQHRGQESAGIVSMDTDGMHEHKGMGLVPDVFSEAHLQKLAGKTAIGHVRYSTTGRSSFSNAQPFVAHYKGMDIALAHNGNLVNCTELREMLENRGAIFSTGNDTEVIMHLLVRALREKELPEAVREVCSQIRGAYCLLFMVGNTLIAVRDPHGFHPLALGRLDGCPVFASETCAFDLLEAEYERSIEAGEMVIVDANGERSEKLREPLPQKPSQCIFELVYFARPDSYVFNEQVYVCRKQMGWQLAHESTPDVDFILPFPDSGVYAAVGFAQCAELPYEHANIRNHYVGRTFIQPTQSMRNFGVRVKINPVRAMIEGKKICIVDDSIVRGTTMMTRVKKLRELGAKEVHIRISCPPVKFPCRYGIDFSSRGELIAARHDVDAIARQLDVDSLHYLSIEGLLRSVMHSDSYCLACFNGDYPVPCAEQQGKCCLGKG
ncbi:MAG: amidophosphoribosyltransferase [Desulfovibrio sp.]|nr:amidophosphoribosyltransferase [Desulfovibrio sp.]